MRSCSVPQTSNSSNSNINLGFSVPFAHTTKWMGAWGHRQYYIIYGAQVGRVQAYIKQSDGCHILAPGGTSVTFQQVPCISYTYMTSLSAMVPE